MRPSIDTQARTYSPRSFNTKSIYSTTSARRPPTTAQLTSQHQPSTLSTVTRPPKSRVSRHWILRPPWPSYTTPGHIFDPFYRPPRITGRIHCISVLAAFACPRSQLPTFLAFVMSPTTITPFLPYMSLLHDLLSALSGPFLLSTLVARLPAS